MLISCANCFDTKALKYENNKYSYLSEVGAGHNETKARKRGSNVHRLMIEQAMKTSCHEKRNH